jgi:hypothetical protein
MADKFNIGRANARKQLDISNFYGVDYSTSELNVSNLNAVEISNIVYKDKVNQKRNGWQQVLEIKPFIYHTLDNEEKTNGTEINAVWEFVGEDNQTHIVAHVGNILYELNKIDNFLFSKAEPLVQREIKNGKVYNYTYELENYKSSAFVGDKRLYILGGNYFYVLRFFDGKFELTKVEDNKETYIPMTRVGVTYKDSPIASSTAYDDVNLMTQWRKNKLVSGTYFDDGETVRTTRFFDYELESAITSKKESDLNDIEIIVQSLEVNENGD